MYPVRPNRAAVEVPDGLDLGVLPSSSTSFDSIIFGICSPMSQKRTSMPTTLIPKGGGREGKGREGGRVGKGREGGREEEWGKV